ncbi:MAG TPA: OsmC family protein [Candidatus Competibacteraceae bacterium]|nr:OsmC family protein [Candidatus Competibacteraceae bacterium]
MSEHKVELIWHRHTPDFTYERFDRTHTWRFSGGQTVQGSAAPAYHGDARLANPEEGLVAALASCHMLTFLALAALKRWQVDSYHDEPGGELGKDDAGNIMIARITLRPHVVFGGEHRPDAQQLLELHHKAHAKCFVANSLKSKVVLDPRLD